jgi:cell division septation protein DedD
MKYLSKTGFDQKRFIRAGALLLALLLAVLLVTLPQQPAAAQESDTGRVTYASVDGNSKIVSQQVVLAAEDFAQADTLNNVQATLEGLTLVEGVSRGVYVSQVIRSPLGFTTDVGPTWLADIPTGASITVEARSSNDGQTWGDWSAVPVEYYPTRAGEYGGVLIWANQSDLYIQFRLTLQVGGSGVSPLFRRLTLFFNDTSQGPSDEAAMAQARRENAEVACLTCPAKPLVIPRTAWGCPTGQSSPYWPPAYQSVTHIVINHTVNPNSADDWARVVRSIWNFHANILGWGDVGYQYLIDPLGNIYEGRAGGDDVIGAFDGFNRGAMGIGYIGCYGNCEYLGLTSAEPAQAMLDAGNELIAWKAGQKGLDPFGSGNYCWQALPNIVARSEVTCRGGSLSPGDFLEAKIPAMRVAVAEKIAACQTPTPTPTFTPSPTATPSSTPTATSSPTATPTSQTPTPTFTPSPTATPTDQTPTPTDTPTPTVTPSPTSTLIPGSLVRLSPASLQLNVDGTGVTQVEVVDISNLYGVDLRLIYDPGVVEVVDVDSNTAGVQVGLGTVFQGVQFFVAKNEASEGVINFIASRQSPAPGFSGTGSLIEITWRGKATGQTPVTLDKVKLADPNGLSLSAATQDGQIQVGTTVVVRGQVELEGSRDNSGVVVSTGQRQVETGPDGAFELAIAPADAYLLTVAAPGYLSARAEGEILTSAAVIDVGSIMLPGGEVTGDNQIDIFDLALIGNRYGGNDALADINGDGIVDIFDLTLSASNYGQRGPIIIGLNTQ